jgi:hypothetical protein
MEKAVFVLRIAPPVTLRPSEQLIYLLGVVTIEKPESYQVRRLPQGHAGDVRRFLSAAYQAYSMLAPLFGRYEIAAWKRSSRHPT